MALVILQPNETNGPYGGFSPDSIIGATGDETVYIAGNGVVLLDPSFSAGGDTIYIDGNAGDYDVYVDGSNIVLTSGDGAEITIPAGGAGVDIHFNDDIRGLVISGDALTLGDQEIPADGTVVPVDDGDVVNPPVDGRTVGLVIGSDFIVPGDENTNSSDGDDTFRARVAQNNEGAQANQLGSGDYIDGGDGNDTLDAWIQGATSVNGTPNNTTIAPETTDVENIEFRAVHTGGSLGGIDPDDLVSLFLGGYGPTIGVEVDASDMYGVTDIGSYQSDDSLTVYDMTTLANDGETIRPTSDITVHMDHTSNNSSAGDASDLTVLFDRDYLICDNEIPTGGQLFLEVMDLDAAIYLQNGVTTYPDGLSNGGLPIEGPLDDSPYAVINFTLGGEERTLNIGTDYDTYPELLAAIQAAIASQPDLNGSIDGGANIVASLGPSFTASDTDGQPGGSATGTTIVLTNVGNDAQFTDVTLEADPSVIVPGEKDFHLQPSTEAPEGQECVIEVDVVLDKVGRGGDGGELTIGGMVPDLDNVWDQESQSGLPELERGVEQFNVTVDGNDSEDSSLAAMRSTDNTLRTIIIADEGDAEADLVIGNQNTDYDGFDPLFTDGILGGFSLYQFLNGGGLISDVIDQFIDLTDPFTGDLSSVKNNALKDVLTFDASAFDNDTEVHAFFSDEVVDKYLNLGDTEASDGDAPDATMDNVDGDAMWTFGDGENIVNVNISQTNMAVEGTATREDFSFNVFTNGGEDLVQVQLGDGDGTAETGNGTTIEAWYHNHLLNQNLHIDTGADDDKVETWGSTAANIDLGAGDDVAFVDNSGVTPDDGDGLIGGLYNYGRATWVFNTLSTSTDVDNLASEAPTAINNVANLQLRVSFEDIESGWVEVGDSFGSIDGETIDDLDIVQAMKDAINNDPILGELLVAEDGPGRTLVVRSLVDGTHTVVDLNVELRTDPTPFTPAQIAGDAITFDAAAGLGALGFNGAGDQIPGRFESDFGTDGGDLTGADSTNVNNNNVEGGLGDDLIVLSSQGDSIETIDINGAFDDDVILNFTAGVAETATEEQQIDFGGDDAPEGTVTVTLNGVDYVIQVGGGGEPVTPAEIAAAVADAIDTADNGFMAEVDGGDPTIVTITALETGIDYPEATVVATADGPPEEQDIAFTGSTANVTSVSMTFGDTTHSVTGADLATNITVASALADLFEADGYTVVDDGDGTFSITNDEAGDIDNASFTISGGGGITLDASATEVTPGGEPLTTADVTTITNGDITNSGGFDIFDVTTVLGGAVAGFINDQPTLAPGNGDGLERAAISDLVDNSNWVAIIDTVEADDVPTANTGQSELQLIQQIATSEDTVSGPGTGGNSIAITVNDDNVGHFYLIADGTGVGDVQVSLLGSVELGQFDDAGKAAIGNWDAMSIYNFTPLSPDALSSSYAGVDF